MTLSAAVPLELVPWVRLKHCNVRDRWVLLVPEQVLYPCPQTVEVLQRLETPTSLKHIVETLSEDYDAPPEIIEEDLAPILAKLLEDGFVRQSTH